MPSWLLIVIVASLVTLLYACLVGALLIKFAKVINAKDKIIKELLKDNSHKEQLLNAYGVKEIHIGREE